MNATELKQALADIVKPLGGDAHASIVISGNGGGIYVSAEASWKPGADKKTWNTANTFEEAIEQVGAWVAEAPMRNRVATAEDLGIAA